MTIAFEISTSVEEELEALTRSQWELGLLTAAGDPVEELQGIAPPPSSNTVVWPIHEDCLVAGLSLWRDGHLLHRRHFGHGTLRLHSNDTLTVHYSLSAV